MGDVRSRRAVDVAAGLLVVLALVEAGFAARAADAEYVTLVPVDPTATLVAAAAALVAAVLLAAGARSARLRARARPGAAALLVVAAAGWCLSRVEPVRVIDRGVMYPEGLDLRRIAVPAVVACLVTATFAAVAAVRLRSDRRAGEIAAGALVTWGAAQLAALSAAPASWQGVPPPLFLSGDGDAYAAWVVLTAAAVPAAALVVLGWLAGPRAGVRRIAARCRGACAAVATLLLAEAALSGSGLPGSLPNVVVLLAGAGCAAVAAYRWSLAPYLATAAAVAGLVSLGYHTLEADNLRDTFFPEPAHWVTVGLVPFAVAFLVMWSTSRPAPRPPEPATAPAG